MRYHMADHVSSGRKHSNVVNPQEHNERWVPRVGSPAASGAGALGSLKPTTAKLERAAAGAVASHLPEPIEPLATAAPGRHDSASGIGVRLVGQVRLINFEATAQSAISHPSEKNNLGLRTQYVLPPVRPAGWHQYDVGSTS